VSKESKETYNFMGVPTIFALPTATLSVHFPSLRRLTFFKAAVAIGAAAILNNK
jgi:hypothetical protein